MNQYGQRSFFTLRCVEVTSGGLLDLATWDPVNGLQPISSQDASDRRVGEKIQNKTFIVTSRLGAPFLMYRLVGIEWKEALFSYFLTILNMPDYREPKEGEVLVGNDRFEGYSLDLIDAIAKFLNFKYVFELAPDGRYGSFNKQTQQWDGLVKQILDGVCC